MRLAVFLLGLSATAVGVAVWSLASGAGLVRTVVMVLVVLGVAQMLYLGLILILARKEKRAAEPETQPAVSNQRPARNGQEPQSRA